MAKSSFESLLNQSIALAKTAIQLDKSLLSLTSYDALMTTIVETKTATLQRLTEVHQRIATLCNKYAEQVAREAQNSPDGDTGA